ncbi:MAG TPA: cytochrome c1 [Acidiferrobacterales bacterium]|nr:cytochrome c1 [Acidiferrobacterales bacterium]
MKKAILILLCAALPGVSLASGGEHVKLDAVKIDLSDKASLQRGARTFVNYCLSCHSASYMRYNRMGEDLDISDELVKGNLMFAADKTGELMKTAMPREDAMKWFGTAPPDLSLVARSRGPNWFYTYMRSFYRDDRSPSGWDNTVFPNVAMPHVLHDVQGLQRAVYRTEKHESESVKDGKKVKKVTEEKVFDHFEIEKPGSMTPQQYDESIRDLTNFMVYVGEPAKLVRYRIGIVVLVFMAIFLVVAYLLKKEYWKDVH